MQLTKPDGILVGGRGDHVRCRRAIVFESGFAADLRCSPNLRSTARGSQLKRRLRPTATRALPYVVGNGPEVVSGHSTEHRPCTPHSVKSQGRARASEGHCGWPAGTCVGVEPTAAPRAFNGSPALHAAPRPFTTAGSMPESASTVRAVGERGDAADRAGFSCRGTGQVRSPTAGDLH